MRKLYLLTLSCSLWMASCIDNEYDLSKLDTDNIAIGDETSRFEAPMARIRVSMKEINSNDEVRIDQLFNEADVWFPTDLPDVDENGGFVYVQKLLNDQSYLNDELLPRLIEEMVASPTKLDEVATLLQEKYFADFTELLPGVSQSEFKTIFMEQFTSNTSLRESLAAEVKTIANTYLSTLDIDMNNLEYPVDRIDLSDDVINMLADNLDPAGTPDPKNTLHLGGTIDNRMPVTLQIAPLFSPTQITFTTTILANRSDNELPETQLYAEDLRTIVRGVNIEIPIVIEKYYPGKGFDAGTETDSQTQLSISLHLIKRGALKFDL